LTKKRNEKTVKREKSEIFFEKSLAKKEKKGYYNCIKSNVRQEHCKGENVC